MNVERHHGDIAMSLTTNGVRSVRQPSMDSIRTTTGSSLGIRYALMLDRFGAYYGYAQIPEEHEWYGFSISELANDRLGFEMELDYARPAPDGSWWIGFSANQLFRPDPEAAIDTSVLKGPLFDPCRPIYTFDMAIRHCMELAGAIARVATPPGLMFYDPSKWHTDAHRADAAMMAWPHVDRLVRNDNARSRRDGVENA